MRKTLELSIAVVILACCFCSADTLILRDGSRHSGTFVSATSRVISFKEGTIVHRYGRSKVQSIEFDGGATSLAAHVATPALTSKSRASVVLPAGSEIVVLTNESIDSKTATEGQVFPADVAENVTNAAGEVVIPKGSEAELVIRRIASPGAVTGTSELALDLQSIKVGGRRYTVSTTDVEQKGREGLGANKRTAEMLATTLNVEFDPDRSWDEKKEIYRISNKIVRTANVTQSAVGDKRGLWTTVIASAIFIFD